jgi:hypothetical protein
LALSRLVASEFLYLVLAAPIMRIAAKDGHQFLDRIHDRGLAVRDFAKVAFTGWSG